MHVPSPTTIKKNNSLSNVKKNNLCVVVIYKKQIKFKSDLIQDLNGG